MSTRIKEIEGRYEDPFGDGTEYVETMLSLTRFSGGREKGVMLQLTTGMPGYIQLTKEQCLELSKDLVEAFDYDKYPSE